jgi:hypothetical protein
MSFDDVFVLLEGNLICKIEPRLNEDQKTFMKSVYKIDNSAKGVANYDIVKSIGWVANSEARRSYVIILSENPSYFECLYGQIIKEENKGNIRCCNSKEFTEKANKAMFLFQKRQFSSIHDALNAVFFIGT